MPTTFRAPYAPFFTVTFLRQNGVAAQERSAEFDQLSIATYWTFARYHESHALGAFELRRGGANNDLARRMLAWIRRHTLEKFTFAECFDTLRRCDGVAASDDFLPALSILESRHQIRELSEQTPARRGRKPSPSFTVNPATHDTTG